MTDRAGNNKDGWVAFPIAKINKPQLAAEVGRFLVYGDKG
jgi:hypothetical protein